MAALKTDPPCRDAKSETTAATPLMRAMREFEELALRYETGLLRSLDDVAAPPEPTNPGLSSRRRDQVRQHACHLAITEMSSTYMRKQIRRSLNDAESLAKSAEEQLHTGMYTDDTASDSTLGGIHSGHFRLYSTDLFDLLGQPTDLRFGTLRFFHSTSGPDADSDCTTLEMALNNSFFVADSAETLPYHTFKMPAAPSLQNRGILSRKPQDHGAFPDYDSWLLFTFLGNGCLKLEVPVEMCADVYGGPLRGRENEEVIFWGVFVDDDLAS